MELLAFRVRDRAECRAAVGSPGDDQQWVLFIGRLEREKGVFDLLHAMAQVASHKARVRLVLVGDGVDRAACQAFVRENRIPAFFAGARLPAEVPLWIGASDLLALPSWAEGTPNVILEALASGRRVVASDVGGIPDVVNHSVLGELVPPQSPGELARALLRVLGASYDPAEVRERAPVRTWEQSARALHQVLVQAAKGAADGNNGASVQTR